VNEEEKQAVYCVLIFGAFATTISLFLHTLRFKHYISPITSYLTYMASYLGTFYGFYLISNIFIKNLDLTLLVFVGILINFGSRKVQHTYQVLIMVLFYSYRYDLFPVITKMFEGQSSSMPGRVMESGLIL